MIDKKDFASVYDTLLSTPGMSDLVKVDLKISRKNVLLLAQFLQRGFTAKNIDDGIFMPDMVPKESLQELTLLANELLEKAGLVPLNDKLKGLLAK